MNHQTTAEQLARLRNHYRQAAMRYEAAKKVTDTAEAARDAACQACEAAHQAWEAACAEEVCHGQAVRQTALAYQAASDAVFLTEIGIVPSSVLISPKRCMTNRSTSTNVSS
jgi:hypothetical protein